MWKGQMSSECLRLSWAHKKHLPQHSTGILTSSSFRAALILLFSPRNANLPSQPGAHQTQPQQHKPTFLKLCALWIPPQPSFLKTSNKPHRWFQFCQLQKEGRAIPRLSLTLFQHKPQLRAFPGCPGTHLQHQWLWYRLRAPGWCSSSPGSPWRPQRGT